MPALLRRAGPDVATEAPGNGLGSGAGSDDVAGGRIEGRTSGQDGGHVGLASFLRAVLGETRRRPFPAALEMHSELVKPRQVGVVTWPAPLTLLCPPPGHRQRGVHLRV